MTEPNEPGPPPPADPSPQPSSAAPPTDPPVQPPRPDGDWREPPWFPPDDRDRRERRERGSNAASIVFGLIVLGIGIYYFLDRTLGIAMPAIRWGSLWPILLVILGGLILFRSVERR